MASVAATVAEAGEGEAAFAELAPLIRTSHALLLAANDSIVLAAAALLKRMLPPEELPRLVLPPLCRVSRSPHSEVAFCALEVLRSLASDLPADAFAPHLANFFSRCKLIISFNSVLISHDLSWNRVGEPPYDLTRSPCSRRADEPPFVIDVKMRILPLLLAPTTIGPVRQSPSITYSIINLE